MNEYRGIWNGIKDMLSIYSNIAWVMKTLAGNPANCDQLYN
jgi:hypothetical protein